MDFDISLVGAKQMLMTDEGYMPLGKFYERFTLQDTPLLGATDKDRRFCHAPLTHMERRFHEGEIIRVQSDTFELVATPQHKVWLADGDRGDYHCWTLEEAFGRGCQFMGIHPMPLGDCPGYLVGPGCWYRETVAEFVFDLRPESGFVFSRTSAREAGIWSGVFPEED